MQFTSYLSAQVTSDFKQNQPNLIAGSEDFEELRHDLLELIETRRSASRQYVKEVISSDINLLAHKIESLKDDVSNKESTKLQWSEVIAGRRKIHSHTRHIESNPIPVIHNRYDLFDSCHIGEDANTDSAGIHFKRTFNIKTDKSMRAKHNILIIGDSHA
jgi:hypothetical protein